MFKSLIQRLGVVVAVGFLAACGGGGGGDGSCNPLANTTCSSTSSDGGSTVVSNGAKMTLTVDSPTLATDGVGTVTVRATVKDSSNAAVAGETVTFSADSGTLSSASETTSTDGVATVTFNTDDDKSNRIATITAKFGSLTAINTVSIQGTTLAFGGDQAGVVGQSMSMVVTLKGADNKAIASTPVTLKSTLGNPVPASVTTDSQGQATFSFVPTVGSTTDDVISASALGASASQSVSISSVNFKFTNPAAGSTVPVSSDGGCQRVDIGLSGFSPATVTVTNPRGTVHSDAACSVGSASSLSVTVSGGVASAYVKASSAGSTTLLATARAGSVTASTNLAISFVAETPSSIVVQGTPSTVSVNGNSNITALVKDASGNPVTGKTVTFSAPSGGGTPSPVVSVTDDAGRASTVFTADSTISGKDSVVIKATVFGTSIEGQTELTVSGQAVNVVLGTDNVIALVSPVKYRKSYAAFVTDTAGNPVANQTVTIALNYVSFGKGYWYSLTGTTATIKWAKVLNATCLAEDPNNNGIKESGEPGAESNGNSTFEPNGSALVRPSSGTGSSLVTVTTDSTGSAEFLLEYPRNYGSWVTVEIIATAVVAGKNNISSIVTALPVPTSEISDEAITPPFATSPFGTESSCSDTL